VPNERLRDSLLRNGLTPDQVAKATGVDPKTVERWITKDRTPYARHRHAIAAMVQETERYLWPNSISPERVATSTQSEIVNVYPRRHAVPADMWDRLLSQSEVHIGILIYAGMFLIDNPNLIKSLRAKAGDGVRVRLLVGDPSSPAVARRSVEEGIGKNAIPGKVRNILAILKPLAEVEGVQIRCHGTQLYNSIYRFDDEMLVNTHVYGFMAPHAPVFHLRRLAAGELFDTYLESFESVWSTAKPPKW
jgi:transcriptional regulator with XRE-family HTH domain